MNEVVNLDDLFQAINTLRNSTDRSKFTFETFGQTMLLEADPSILTPLTLSASSIATLGSNNVPQLGGERESVRLKYSLSAFSKFTYSQNENVGNAEISFAFSVEYLVYRNRFYLHFN